MPPKTAAKRRPSVTTLEPVEPRKLLSGTPSAPSPADNFYPQITSLYVSTAPPYAPGNRFVASVALSPSGSSWGTVPETTVSLSLSADAIAGNADDILLGTVTTTDAPSVPLTTGNFSVNLPSSLPDGAYHVIATAPNAAPLVGQTITVTTPPPGRDLTFHIDGDVYTSGGMYLKVWPTGQTAIATVANLGADDSGPWTMAVYLSKDRIYGNADDVPLPHGTLYTAGGTTVPGSTNVFASLPVDVPAGLVPDGYYYPILVLDSTNQIAEIDEANNVMVARPIVVGPPSADLSIASVSTTSPATVGGTLGVDVDVMVQGDYPGPIDARFRLVSDADATTSYELNNGFAILDAPFAPNAVTRVHLDLSVPADVPAGQYHLESSINVLKYEAETNDANDQFSGVPVTVDPPPVRPLFSLPAGATRRVPLVVTNDAGKPVRRTYKVRFFLSADATLSKDDTPFSRQTITKMLAPGTSANLRAPFTVPTSARLGTQYLIAVARPLPTAKEAKRLKSRPAAALHTATTSTGRVRAVIPVAVTPPKLSAAVRSVRTRRGLTRVTVRVTNNANRPLSSTAATIRLIRPNNAVLASAETPLHLKPGHHLDYTFLLRRKVPHHTRAIVEL